MTCAGTKTGSCWAEEHLHRDRATHLPHAPDGGLRHKAGHGELRIALPVGYVWGDAPGEVRCDPDAEVVLVVRNVFARFAELGPVWRVWPWFLDEVLAPPVRNPPGGPLRWVQPSFAAIRQLLTKSVYAGVSAGGGGKGWDQLLHGQRMH